MTEFQDNPYRSLLDRWDVQQAAYIAAREARFDAVLDVLALTCPPDMLVVDLACGPGSLSERIARRFPQARIVAIDLDPVLLALGRRALTQFDGRLRFVQADLASATWRTALGDARPHAAVSSTALHWLLPEQQVVLYRDVQDALRAGGVFLNADHQRFDERTPVWKDWAERHDTQTQEAGWAAGAETWETWWAEASATEGLAERVAERQALFANRPQSLPTTVGFHIAALRQAGFAEAGTVWQLFDDYVLAAHKAGAAR